jgi:hypothetical protein
VISSAPPAATVVIVVGAAKSAKAAAEVTVETTASTKPTPVATEAVTTAAKAAPVAATTATDQDQWAACCTQQLLLGATDIVRLCDRGSGRTSERKSTNKTRRDKTAFYDCAPFAGVWTSGPLAICMAPTLSGVASSDWLPLHRALSGHSEFELVVSTALGKCGSCDMMYSRASTSLEPSLASRARFRRGLDSRLVDDGMSR